MRDTRTTVIKSAQSEQHVSRRRLIIAEVVGSLGAIAASAAAVVGTSVLWPQLTNSARVAIPAIGSFALFAGGAAIPRGEEKSSDRLSCLLWLLAVASLVAAVAVTSKVVFDLADQNVVLVSGAISLVVSIFLLNVSRTLHMVIAVAGSAVGTTVGLMLQYDEARSKHVGAVLLCLGASLALLAWAELFPARGTGLLVGAAIAFTGAELLNGVAEHWPIIAGGLVAVGMLVLFVSSRDRSALVAGLVLTFVVMVQGILRLADDKGGGRGNYGAILLIFIIGAVVVTSSVLAFRSLHRPRGTQ